MRVTESRMLDLASEGVSQARDRSAAAAAVVSSGQRVSVPSDDPIAWEDGMRAEARKTMSSMRAGAIAGSRQRLADADGAFSTIGTILRQVVQLGVQFANDTYSASERVNGASEVRGLRDALLAAANTRDADGQYVLAGTRGAQPAFDATGKFVGDAVDRSVQVGEAQTQAVSVSGSLLTAASGVDIYATVDGIATALANNDVVAVRNALASLNTAVNQVSAARGLAGVRMKALDDADSSRLDLEQTLEEIRSRSIDVDPVKAASDFTSAKNALEAAQAVAQQIVTLTQPR